MSYTYQYEISKTDGSVKIIGLPYKTKFVEIPRDERFRKLYSYVLIKIDLSNAKKYLERAINEKDSVIREGLFRIAVVLYVKCFLPPKNGGRTQLMASNIYASTPGEPIKCHNKFVCMRHKYVAHDELDYKEAQIGIVLNMESKQKVGIASLEKQAKFDYDDSIKILYTLCEISVNKVEEKLSDEFKRAEEYFNSKDFEELASYQEVSIQVEEEEMKI